MNFDEYLDYRYRAPGAVSHFSVQRIIELTSNSDADVVNCCGEAVKIVKVKDGSLAYTFPATGINITNVEHALNTTRRYSLLLLVPEYMRNKIGERCGICYIPSEGRHCLPVTTSWINKQIRLNRER